MKRSSECQESPEMTAVLGPPVKCPCPWCARQRAKLTRARKRATRYRYGRLTY